MHDHQSECTAAELIAPKNCFFSYLDAPNSQIKNAVFRNRFSYDDRGNCLLSYSNAVVRVFFWELLLKIGLPIILP